MKIKNSKKYIICLTVKNFPPVVLTENMGKINNKLSAEEVAKH